LLHALPTVFGVVVIVFVLMRVVPGDPIAMMVVGEATPDDIAALRALYGLDKPLLQQFVIYLGSLLRGDLGVSISLRQDVLSLVLGRLPATLELAFVAMLASTVLGVLLALAAVHWRGTWVENAVDGASALWLSIPEFLWAMLLIIALGVLLPILPISGRVDPTHISELSSQFYLLESIVRGKLGLACELIQHLILPATALSLPLIAVIVRVLKASLAEALAQDYIVLARVKGFDDQRILTREALPNAIAPALTVGGVHFVFLVGGTVLVELIFSYPGIGNMLYTAAVNRDLPLIQGVTIIFALVFILLNLAIDLIYPIVNPRVRQG